MLRYRTDGSKNDDLHSSIVTHRKWKILRMFVKRLSDVDVVVGISSHSAGEKSHMSLILD